MTLTEIIRNVCRVGHNVKRDDGACDTLYAVLSSFDEEAVRRLLVVSYAGRGDGDFSPDFERELRTGMPEIGTVVGMLSEKPVAYLERGVDRAKRECFDLDTWKALVS